MTLTGRPRDGTVGYHYAHTEIPLRRDHIFVHGLPVHGYVPWDTGAALSTHRPAVLDVEAGAPA